MENVFGVEKSDSKLRNCGAETNHKQSIAHTLSPFLNIIYTHQYFHDEFKFQNHEPHTGFVFRVGLRFYCGDQLTVLVIHWAEFILARTVNYKTFLISTGSVCTDTGMAVVSFKLPNLSDYQLLKVDE